MTSKRISAILPCFNHANYLHERISSILAQTRPVDEIVFLDDASSDESLSLAKKLLARAHCPTLIVHNNINSACTFAQWNKGIKAASGDLIWIAETDDSCDPVFLERLLEGFEQTKATFAWSQSKVIDQSGIVLHSAREWHEHLFPHLFETDFAMEGNIFVRDFLSCINLIPNASAAIFERDRYLSVGQANESMRYAGDWLQWIKMVQDGRVCFISEELNSFRCHPATTRSCPDIQRLYSERLACMATALALPNHREVSTNGTRSVTQVKSDTIRSALKNRVFVYNILSNFTVIDVPFLNTRIRKKGVLATFSPGALLLLGLLALASWLRNTRLFHLQSFSFIASCCSLDRSKRT